MTRKVSRNREEALVVASTSLRDSPCKVSSSIKYRCAVKDVSNCTRLEHQFLRIAIPWGVASGMTLTLDHLSQTTCVQRIQCCLWLVTQAKPPHVHVPTKAWKRHACSVISGHQQQPCCCLLQMLRKRPGDPFRVCNQDDNVLGSARLLNASV